MNAVLNREICRKCWKKYMNVHDLERLDWVWTERDNRLWGEGIIQCVECGTITNKEIPVKCTYILEQVVMSKG